MDIFQLLKVVNHTIPLFNQLFPCAISEFFFDQSTTHSAFDDNALNANEMNVKPGGKQHVMHSTIIPVDNPNPHLCGQVQLMIFDDDLPPDNFNYEFCGQPKGMKWILKEWGIWDELVWCNGGKPIPGDCAECKMSQKEKEKQAWEAAESMAGQDKEGTDEDIDHEPIITSKTL